ncbi:MAG: hypothetical protein WAZ19_04505 [Anaerolineae bacterium]
MLTQATKEAFTLLNLLCGGVLALLLAVYYWRGQPRRGWLLVLLAVLMLVCVFNAYSVYFML